MGPARRSHALLTLTLPRLLARRCPGKLRPKLYGIFDPFPEADPFTTVSTEVFTAIGVGVTAQTKPVVTIEPAAGKAARIPDKDKKWPWGTHPHRRHPSRSSGSGEIVRSDRVVFRIRNHETVSGPGAADQRLLPGSALPGGAGGREPTYARCVIVTGASGGATWLVCICNRRVDGVGGGAKNSTQTAAPSGGETSLAVGPRPSPRAEPAARPYRGKQVSRSELS